MFEEFLKSDGVFSASDKQLDNSNFNVINTATTASAVTTTATATTATATDVQMEHFNLSK